MACLRSAPEWPGPVLSAEEDALAQEAAEGLEPEERAAADKRLDCLSALGQAVSRCPPPPSRLREAQDLAETLIAFTRSSRLLRVPVRAAALRAYFAAKYQAFELLAERAPGHLVPGLRRTRLEVASALIAEEAYFSCLEDPALPAPSRREAAEDLLSLWETGRDPRGDSHIASLENLWRARNDSPPSFGTMDGTSELTRITMDMEREWQVFIARNVEIDEIRWALEEFLFGLSHEEIQTVRQGLRGLGGNAVGSEEEVRAVLGRPPAYGKVDASDLCALYGFYADRRDAAAFRRRMSLPGPSESLEGLYLKSRLVQDTAR